MQNNSNVKKLEIDDIAKINRPTLGNEVSVVILRVIRHLTLEEIIGIGSGGILYRAGKNIGMSLQFDELDDFLDWIEKSKIGIPEVDGNFVRIYECVTCSGISYIGRTVCHFEGGLVAGFLEKLWNKHVLAKEVKCFGLGHDVCEFEIITKD
ncbi:V4R domain-containing protein [Methanocaldococcus sp.]